LLFILGYGVGVNQNTLSDPMQLPTPNLDVVPDIISETVVQPPNEQLDDIHFDIDPLALTGTFGGDDAPPPEQKNFTCALHTLAWTNVDPRLIDAHKKVMNHFGLPVQYTIEDIPHGYWMDRILESAPEEVVGFIESVCVPTNANIVNICAIFAGKAKSFIGPAQAANHLQNNRHIYAAPCFHFIHRDTWMQIGKSYSETMISDVGQMVSMEADRLNINYRTLYPTHFTRPAVDGYWQLGHYGTYGIGTFFMGGIFHLFQGRLNTNVELFVKVCDSIVDGTFTTDGMIECTAL
jgi:hypothetical protein